VIFEFFVAIGHTHTHTRRRV